MFGQDLLDDRALLRGGGHVAGGTVLHWAAGAAERGAVLSGDIVPVVQDQRYVSFMDSYPKLIPLPAATVQRIAAALGPYAFDQLSLRRLVGRVVAAEAKAAVTRSPTRYRAALSREG